MQILFNIYHEFIKEVECCHLFMYSPGAHVLGNVHADGFGFDLGLGLGLG